jgi:hypothetical protein
VPATAPGPAPLEAALAQVRRRRGPGGTAGLAPDLVVTDPTGWTAASGIVSGTGLDAMLDAGARWWDAPPHVVAALAWRFYTYWLAMPPVLGWATARRLPLLHPDDVLIRFNREGQFLTVGLRRLRLAVLPGDPLASSPDTEVVESEEDLLARLRRTLRADHLDPLLARIQDRVRLGERTLLGSLASAAAYAAVRGVDAPPEQVTANAATVLSALDVADLVTLEPGPDGHPTVWRLTCCLAFALPEPKLCSGCCLRR